MQIEQNIRFQEREWKLQRVGWTAFGAIVIAAMLGLFGGGGMLAKTRADTGDGFAIEYPRFERNGTFTKLRIDVTHARPTLGELTIWIGREYFQDIDIELITPTPMRTELADDKMHFIFSIRDHPEATYRFVFTLKANKFGIKEGIVGLADGSNRNLQIRQLFYP